MKHLHIEHNHGSYDLADVEVIQDPSRPGCRSVKGRVIKGHSTSRLFSASATERLEEGSMFEIDIWNRVIYPHPTLPDSFRVSIVFC